MATNAIVDRVCRLPIDFYGGSKSMAELVSDSGIGADPSRLTVSNMIEYITIHPEVVEAWLRWSENKRVTSGWYFSRNGPRFEVGFFPDGEVSTFSDPSLACAEFVVREVKAMLDMRRARTNG